MFNAVKERYAEQDIVFKAAAVSDYTPTDVLQHKMKKQENYLSHSNVKIFIGFSSDDNELTMHFKNKDMVNIKKGKK